MNLTAANQLTLLRMLLIHLDERLWCIYRWSLRVIRGRDLNLTVCLYLNLKMKLPQEQLS